MAMRRGHHTSRVLSALGSRANENGANGPDYNRKPHVAEILPNEFDNVHEEEI
jgi:acetolactate synthase-1/3 small subunit